MCHHAKFRAGRSSHCGDVAVFLFFNMMAVCHLGFLKVGHFNCLFPSICDTMPNFVRIGQTVEEMWSFFNFSRWRLCAILDLLYVSLDHPRSVFGCLYHCAKCGLNLCSSFDNMQFLIF